MGSKSKSRAMIRILFVLHFKIISDLLLCLKREKELPIAEIRLIGLKKIKNRFWIEVYGEQF